MNQFLFVINFEPSVAKFKSRGRWLFNSRSWINWKKNFPKIVERQSFVENCENFADSLLSVSRTEFKRSKEIVNPKFAKPWWTERCAELIKSRRKCKNTLKRHPIIDNLIALHRVEALVR